MSRPSEVEGERPKFARRVVTHDCARFADADGEAGRPTDGRSTPHLSGGAAILFHGKLPDPYGIATKNLAEFAFQKRIDYKASELSFEFIPSPHR